MRHIVKRYFMYSTLSFFSLTYRMTSLLVWDPLVALTPRPNPNPNKYVWAKNDSVV